MILVKGLGESIIRPFNKGTNPILLDPELKKAFPTSEDVNKALRVILQAFEPKKGKN